MSECRKSHPPITDQDYLDWYEEFIPRLRGFDVQCDDGTTRPVTNVEMNWLHSAHCILRQREEEKNDGDKLD